MFKCDLWAAAGGRLRALAAAAEGGAGHDELGALPRHGLAADHRWPRGRDHDPELCARRCRQPRAILPLILDASHRISFVSIRTEYKKGRLDDRLAHGQATTSGHH